MCVASELSSCYSYSVIQVSYAIYGALEGPTWLPVAIPESCKSVKSKGSHLPAVSRCPR